MKVVRQIPRSHLEHYPCSVVAVACALGQVVPIDTTNYLEVLTDDGYATLHNANHYIRNNLKILKRIDFKRGNRPTLKELNLFDLVKTNDTKLTAIVCVLGHFLYIDQTIYEKPFDKDETMLSMYQSFYNNDDDEVVAVWIIKED